jgi:glutaredoxin-like protein NrdH
MAKIIVYTMESCPKCSKLKKFLEANSVTFKEAEMATPEALTELRFNGVFTVTAPVLQINDIFLTHEELFIREEINTEKILGILLIQPSETSE